MTLFSPSQLDLRFAVIDVETTGIDAEYHRVVELAIVEVEHTGRELDAWSTLLSVPGNGALGATHVHGITREMTAGAPCFEEVAAEVRQRLAGRVVVGHVVAFDIGHLAAEFSRAGLPLPAVGNFSVCTRELVKRHLAADSHSLAACCAHLGLRCAPAHRALDDARATAALFLALRERFGDCGATRAHFAAAAAEWPPPFPVVGTAPQALTTATQ